MGEKLRRAMIKLTYESLKKKSYEFNLILEPKRKISILVYPTHPSNNSYLVTRVDKAAPLSFPFTDKGLRDAIRVFNADFIS